MILPAKDGPYLIPAHVRTGLYAKYRGIDVDRELQLMALWLEKNKASRPTNPIRFCENWLKKLNKPIKGATAHAESRTQAQPRAGVATPPVAPPTLTLVDPGFRSSAGPVSLRDVIAPLRAAIANRRKV